MPQTFSSLPQTQTQCIKNRKTATKEIKSNICYSYLLFLPRMQSKHTYPYVFIGLLFTRLMYNKTYRFFNEIFFFPKFFWVVQLLGQNLRNRRKKIREKMTFTAVKILNCCQWNCRGKQNKVVFLCAQKGLWKKELLKVSLWSLIVHMTTRLKLILAHIFAL